MTEKTNSQNCIFCKIIRGEIPASRLFEDEEFISIQDIHPQSQIHFLVVPKGHIVSLDTAFPKHGPGMSVLIGKLFETATRIARQQGLLPEGFRTVMNTGKNGGQTVSHIHLHVLGGEPLRSTFGSGLI